MMCFLLVNDFGQIIELAVPDGKIAITALPEELLILRSWVLIHADEVFFIFSRRSDWLIVRANLAAMCTWSATPPLDMPRICSHGKGLPKIGVAFVTKWQNQPGAPVFGAKKQCE